jgi:hypothetical protein
MICWVASLAAPAKNPTRSTRAAALAAALSMPSGYGYVYWTPGLAPGKADSVSGGSFTGTGTGQEVE